jgi:hypothetical protein
MKQKKTIALISVTTILFAVTGLVVVKSRSPIPVGNTAPQTSEIFNKWYTFAVGRCSGDAEDSPSNYDISLRTGEVIHYTPDEVAVLECFLEILGFPKMEKRLTYAARRCLVLSAQAEGADARRTTLLECTAPLTKKENLGWLEFPVDRLRSQRDLGILTAMCEMLPATCYHVIPGMVTAGWVVGREQGRRDATARTKTKTFNNPAPPEERLLLTLMEQAMEAPMNRRSQEILDRGLRAAQTLSVNRRHRAALWISIGLNCTLGLVVVGLVARARKGAKHDVVQ